MPGQEAEHRAGRGTGFQREGYQPQVTTAELGALVGQSFHTLIDALKTGKTERLTSYLAFSGRFHRYSRRNQQLIFEQCPQATRVASYVKWKEEGFQVRKMDKEKGEKGISILRPIPPAGYRRSQRIKQLVEGEEKPADEYKETEVGFITRKFRVGTVFDVTHLTPEDQTRVPEFFTTIDGDHDALYQRLIAVAKRDGIEVEETLDTEGAQGTSGMGVVNWGKGRGHTHF